jgi:hypothetical protein
MIATGALLAVALNAATTGDHILAAFGRGLWSVAGMDIVMCAGAGVAVFAARRLSSGKVTVPVAPMHGAPSRLNKS